MGPTALRPSGHQGAEGGGPRVTTAWPCGHARRTPSVAVQATRSTEQGLEVAVRAARALPAALAVWQAAGWTPPARHPFQTRSVSAHRRRPAWPTGSSGSDGGRPSAGSSKQRGLESVRGPCLRTRSCFGLPWKRRRPASYRFSGRRNAGKRGASRASLEFPGGQARVGAVRVDSSRWRPLQLRTWKRLWMSCTLQLVHAHRRTRIF